MEAKATGAQHRSGGEEPKVPQFCFDYLHKTYPEAKRTYNALEKRNIALAKLTGENVGVRLFPLPLVNVDLHSTPYPLRVGFSPARTLYPRIATHPIRPKMSLAGAEAG